MSTEYKVKLKKEGLIEDNYIIDETSTIGEGTSAYVRKGMKRDTGEPFAIKVIPMSSLDSKEKKSLRKQLEIMEMIDHPNIVRVYEYYECHDCIFMVMELMGGGELFDRIANSEEEHYTEKQAAETFRPIVDAVRYCHSLGIVHRDLKPENLLYSSKDDDSLIKVSDFGYANFLIPKSEEKLYTACGTPSYIAPEITIGGGYDSKVDCWSLGVILYVMLCGYPPFYAEDNNELFKLIQEDNYEFHHPYWDKISDGAKDLIKKLLVVDPKKRLSTEEILQHQWLTKSSHNEEKLPFKEDYIKYKSKIKIRNVVNANKIVKIWQNITFKKQ